MAENGAHFSGEGHLIEGQIEGDVNKTIRPIVCDADGHLIIDLDASTITIGTVDIQDSGGNSITATAGSLNVKVTNTVPITGTVTLMPSATALNLFATNDSVPFGVETTILSYTPLFPFSISQVIGWGTYVGEFLIRVDGTIVGGGRTSTAEQTLNIAYINSPIPVGSGQTITITILEYGSGLHQFRCNLLGQ